MQVSSLPYIRTIVDWRIWERLQVSSREAVWPMRSSISFSMSLDTYWVPHILLP